MSAPPPTTPPYGKSRERNDDDGVPRRPADRRQRGSGGVVLADLPAGLRDLAPGRWARPNLDHDGGPDAKPPAARHQHGAVVAGSKMYVVGGAKQGGRLAGDAHELDLATLRWRSLEPKTEKKTDPTNASIEPPVKPQSTNVGVGWLGRVLGLDDDEFGSPPPAVPNVPDETSGVLTRGRLAPCSGHRLFAHRGCVYSVGGGFKAADKPGGGKFEARRRAVYEAVLDVQVRAIAEMRAGANWQMVGARAKLNTVQNLIDLGIVRGNAQDAVMAGVCGLFLPHSLGHLLGLQVHDVGPGGPVPDGALAPGHVVTCEPGIYFVDGLLEPALEDRFLKDFLVRA